MRDQTEPAEVRDDGAGEALDDAVVAESRQQVEVAMAELLTQKEAAARIEVGVKILDQFVADGRISPVGKTGMYLPDEVERVAQERECQLQAIAAQVYSTEQTAATLGVSESYVRWMTRQGTLRSVVTDALGSIKSALYLREDVEALKRMRNEEEVDS